MEYYFNNLDPTTFQRLINAILITRFGEDARLTPLRASDGGRDAETAIGNPYYEYQVTAPVLSNALFSAPRMGRYLFQVKHHRTTDTRLSDARKRVVLDFEREISSNVLNRADEARVNYFILITNVPSSKNALLALDKKRATLSSEENFHGDVWWQEQVIAYLDLLPSLWNSFPMMFAGGVVPVLANIAGSSDAELPSAVRMTLDRQYSRDSSVKFRQIDLERSLAKLFVDLDVDIHHLSLQEQQRLVKAGPVREPSLTPEKDLDQFSGEYTLQSSKPHLSTAVGLLLDESLTSTRRILLEGGPGQGKSTITQMAAQIYRQQILGKTDMEPEGRWSPPQKIRLPLRIELKTFAEWITEKPADSVEEYLASVIRRASGGKFANVDSIHDLVQRSPILLIFDGLDEVGSDELRDTILDKITECIVRFEGTLKTDLRVVVTTRPPAINGRRERLFEFVRFPIAPMEPNRIESYLDRWLSVQLQDDEEQREEVRQSFVKRQNEPHVRALIKNPMQLSVLLHFIRLKGPAFPDRRAELYREYFRIVIDRDVEKSAELRKHREIIEALHQLLGYKIHALTEVDQADGTLSREQLLRTVEAWLKAQGNDAITARDLFKLGEERLGLIVSPKGEGEETRYGYEIQPIREYFAAAFLNDQIPGNAHDVFQALIRRSFWREVAFFLAGLRRPNEKADLLARAKELDQDINLGWRQDGRALTLQLLQEGVFSQPQHIFSDALDFVIDLLDPELINVQNEPRELLEVLPNLIKQGEPKRHIERILRILHNCSNSSDERVLYRLFRVTSQLLESEALMEELLRYEGRSPYIKAKVRLAWPYSWGIDMRKKALAPSFWDGVPNAVWAENWWRTAISHDLATTLPASVTFHKQLVESFATDSSSFLDGVKDRRSTSQWAVWRLVDNQKRLLRLAINGDRTASRTTKAKSSIDFAGLGKSIIPVLKDLIEASDKYISDSSLGPSLTTYLSTMTKYLKRAGLVGLIACRCASNFLRTGMVLVDQGSIYMRSPRLFSNDHFHRFLLENPQGQSFIKELRKFYGNSYKNSNVQRDLYYAYRTIVTRQPWSLDPIPNHVRLKAGAEVTSIDKILTAYILRGKRLPYTWLKYIQLDAELVSSLVKKSRIRLPKLLTVLASVRFRQGEANLSLSVRHIQQIVKVARSSNDPRIMKGALSVLVGSRFINIAGSELILKLLRAVPDDQHLSVMVFRSRNLHYELKTKRILSSEIKVLNEVAENILRSPDDYVFSTTSAAASFLAEHTQLNLSPIHSEERKLGIVA